MIFPIIATLSQAGSIIIDKILLTRQRVELRVFIPVLFIMLFLITAVLFPWLGWVSPELLTLKYQLLFWAMIVIAIVWNVFYYRGEAKEKLHEFELILMAQPLLTILLASIFLANERNFAVVVAAIIAGVALIVSRINHEHLEFNNASIGLIFAVVLMSVELILIDLLLPVLSPVALYAVRTGLIAIFFFIYYRPRLRAIADHHYGLIAATSALGVAQMVSKFYGFQEFGVVYTSLILVLAPVIVYIVSTFWLHERLKPRTLACSIVILACVLYATVMGQ